MVKYFKWNSRHTETKYWDSIVTRWNSQELGKKKKTCIMNGEAGWLVRRKFFLQD